MIKHIAYFFTLLVLCSCEKDETPIAPVARGNVIAGSVTLGAGYPTQVYFDLNNQIATGQNQLSDWDLGFESKADGWKIVLNDGRLMSAWASDYVNIELATDSTGYGIGKRTETAALRYTDPAMGDWRDEKPVYLIDLGYSSSGEYLGMVWVQITEKTYGGYSLKYKIWERDEVEVMTAQTATEYGFVFYKIGENKPVHIPADTDWHIKFTKYTYQFIDPPQAYLVTGVLLNPNGTTAVEFSDKSFLEIEGTDTTGLNFSNQPDIIGYEWKYYDFDLGTYAVDSHRTWIIRTADGFYYKFRFTDFYDEQGQVGTPQFELALI